VLKIMVKRILCVALLALGTVISTPLYAGDKAGKLQGYDAITKPGKSAKVKAKLERVISALNVLGIRPDVEGETLTFFLVEEPVTDPRYSATLDEAKYLGKAKTNDSGFAELDYTPKRTGVYKLEARLRQGSDYIALPAPLSIGVFEPKDKIIIVDIDECVSDTSSLKVAVTKRKDIKTREGAVSTLQELFFKQQRPIIYITAQDDTYINMTKGWAAANKLPPGPVFFWDFWAKSWSEETFKTKLVKSLVKGFPGAGTGIGDHEDDAKAFLANNMTAHIIQKAKDDDLPNFAVHARAWKRIPRHFKEQQKAEKLLGTFTKGDLIDRLSAWNKMSRIGEGLLGYVARFRSSTDLNEAASATLIMGRYEARKAFVKTLDTSSPSKSLNSLVAAWRQGDVWIISQLYRKPEVAVGDCDPPIFPVGGVEVMKRDEPDESTIVYKIKVLPANKNKRPVATSVKFVLLKDGTWKVETPDF
jgi:hypothetical protein